eukprot:GAFH01002090.1.p2 GENE.GAFH01002090.1~~GAFH01002090.1.p2  ORF type:complete len:365 (-),score=19.73 GAFH01002090.1:27-1121(-)
MPHRHACDPTPNEKRPAPCDPPSGESSVPSAPASSNAMPADGMETPGSTSQVALPPSPSPASASAPPSAPAGNPFSAQAGNSFSALATPEKTPAGRCAGPSPAPPSSCSSPVCGSSAEPRLSTPPVSALGRVSIYGRVHTSSASSASGNSFGCATPPPAAAMNNNDSPQPTPPPAPPAASPSSRSPPRPMAQLSEIEAVRTVLEATLGARCPEAVRCWMECTLEGLSRPVALPDRPEGVQDCPCVGIPFDRLVEHLATRVPHLCRCPSSSRYLRPFLLREPNCEAVPLADWIFFCRWVRSLPECVHRARRLLVRPWFHGWVTRQRVLTLLEHAETGAYLVRFSSLPGQFALDFVVPPANNPSLT